MKLFILLVALSYFVSIIYSQEYKPVIFMHGLDGHAYDWGPVLGWLKQIHPQQVAVSLAVNEGGDSHKAMGTQVEDIITTIKDMMQASPQVYQNGFHLVGHSQGGLLTRAVLMTSGLPVANYVSCAGPQYGVYGNYSFEGLDPAEITELLYTPQYQASESVANYWHDALDYDNYVSNALWLSTLNNETFNPNSQEMKENFLRANKTVFNISPEDGVIFPYVSSIFGFWSDDLLSFVPMQNQSIFIDDSFGLQTAFNRGSLIFNIVPNVPHQGWVDDENVFQNYILPYLD